MHPPGSDQQCFFFFNLFSSNYSLSLWINDHFNKILSDKKPTCSSYSNQMIPLIIGSRSHNPGPEAIAQPVKHLLCNDKDVSQIPGTLVKPRHGGTSSRLSERSCDEE